MTLNGSGSSQVSDRKSLGAFYTPRDLAKFISEWLITEPSKRVLEPSFGGGALIDSILERFADVGEGDVIGVELDQSALVRARSRYGNRVELVQSDFLTTDATDLGLVDAVFANPPFTRNHALSPERRRRLKNMLPDFNVSGAPGLWVYFLCHSLSFLREGGRIAFIVPGAASFAHYARSVLDTLCERFATVEIVHVNERVRWEGDAQERALILLASGYREGEALAFAEYTLGRNLLGQYERGPAPAPLPLLPHVELGALAKIGIGCVTGSNRHFLLDSSTQVELNISADDLTLAIARARHISGLTTTTGDLHDLAKLGERTLLLTPRDIEHHRKGVRTQLAKISRDRRARTLWFRKRDPWWQIQLGEQADAVFTYMNHLGPRISLIDAGLAVTNTLHKIRFNNSNPEQRRAICVSMLTTYTQLHCEQIGRIYGGGVLKFEIADAKRIPILLPDHLTKPTFKRIDTALRSGASEHARRLADEAVLPFFCGSGWEDVRSAMDRQLKSMRQQRGIG